MIDRAYQIPRSPQSTNWGKLSYRFENIASSISSDRSSIFMLMLRPRCSILVRTLQNEGRNHLRTKRISIVGSHGQPFSDAYAIAVAIMSSFVACIVLFSLMPGATAGLSSSAVIAVAFLLVTERRKIPASQLLPHILEHQVCLGGARERQFLKHPPVVILFRKGLSFHCRWKSPHCWQVSSGTQAQDARATIHQSDSSKTGS